MIAHYLQHVPFEGLGSIAQWLEANHAEVSATRLFADEALPEVADLDLLIVLGGPMSANDETAFPWLAAEKRFIRATIAAGKAVIGICLGAQLIASAQGAAVRRNATPEIGWFPITATPVGNAPGLVAFPPELSVFHWHGETFDLPSGARRLASSAACENQAFQLGRRVIGLQFHLETTPDAARAIVRHCKDELLPAPFVQSSAEILARQDRDYTALNAWMDKVLAFVCAQ